MPKISIIMPVYNSNKFLDEAVSSILAQTYKDFEFIIVCEYGSDDFTISSLKKWQEVDCRIKIIWNEHKLGISASLNKGWDISSGDFIARMDSDDICLPNRLEAQLVFFENNPEISIIGSNILFVDENGKSIFHSNNLYYNCERVKAELLFKTSVMHPSVMFKKNDLEKWSLRYNNNYTASEDYDLWCRASRHLKITNMEEVLLKYRWHQKGATHTNSNIGEKNFLTVMKDNFLYMGLNFSDDEVKLLSYFDCDMTLSNYKSRCSKIERLLKALVDKNNIIKCYDPIELEKTLQKRMVWKIHPLRFLVAVIIRTFGKITNIYSINILSNYLEWNGFIETLKKLFYYILKI